MDSTLFSVFLILGLALTAFVLFVVKHNKVHPIGEKPKSVKEELFGKKKKKKQSWSISDN